MELLPLHQVEGAAVAPSTSLNLAIDAVPEGANCQDMQNDTQKAEPAARWEKIPMPATEEELDLETMLKLMERLELA